MAEPKEFNQILLYLLIGFMILTGSINTIATKVLTRLKGLKKEFEQHQWFITYGMFIGEMFSLIAYAVVLYKKRTKKSELTIEDVKDSLVDDSQKTKITDEESKKEDPQIEEKDPELPPANNFIFAISAMCDLCCSTISTFAITYLSSSLYQMFRGVELFFIMIFSRIFLKNKIYRHHAVGVGTVIAGLTLVGLSAILDTNKKQEEAKDPRVGMVLLVVAQLFSSSQYVVQENFVKKYTINSFQLVGFEGFWGTVVYTIMLLVFQQVHCDSWTEILQKNVCIQNENNEWRIEDTLYAFRQMNDNFAIWLVYFLYIASIALYNIVGINLTQLVSSTARAVVDTVRTVFVWAFFLIPWPIRPEGSEETFNPLQFAGFVLLIIGTVVYNEIVEIKFMNLDYYTRSKISYRKKNKLGSFAEPIKSEEKIKTNIDSTVPISESPEEEEKNEKE